MIPFAYAPMVIESYRRHLQDLGIEPADHHTAEHRRQEQGSRQILAHIGRWLARRKPELPLGSAAAGASTAAARP